MKESRAAALAGQCQRAQLVGYVTSLKKNTVWVSRTDGEVVRSGSWAAEQAWREAQALFYTEEGWNSRPVRGITVILVA